MTSLFAALEALVDDEAIIKALPGLVAGRKIFIGDVLAVFILLTTEVCKLNAWRIIVDSNLSLSRSEVTALTSQFSTDVRRVQFLQKYGGELETKVLTRITGDYPRYDVWKSVVDGRAEIGSVELIEALNYFEDDYYRMKALDRFEKEFGSVPSDNGIIAVFQTDPAKRRAGRKMAVQPQPELAVMAAAPPVATVAAATPVVSPVPPVAAAPPVVRPTPPRKIEWRNISVVLANISQDDRGTLVNGKHVCLEDILVGTSVTVNGAKITRVTVDKVEIVGDGTAIFNPLDYMRVIRR